jgi:hypothetical protein
MKQAASSKSSTQYTYIAILSLDIEVFPEIGDLSLEEQKFPTKPGNAI